MQMGHRKYYDQMIIDACHFEKNKITDIIDVSTAKDFIQVINMYCVNISNEICNS